MAADVSICMKHGMRMNCFGLQRVDGARCVCGYGAGESSALARTAFTAARDQHHRWAGHGCVLRDVGGDAAMGCYTDRKQKQPTEATGRHKATCNTRYQERIKQAGAIAHSLNTSTIAVRTTIGALLTTVPGHMSPLSLRNSSRLHTLGPHRHQEQPEAHAQLQQPARQPAHEPVHGRELAHPVVPAGGEGGRAHCVGDHKHSKCRVL